LTLILADGDLIFTSFFEAIFFGLAIPKIAAADALATFLPFFVFFFLVVDLADATFFAAAFLGADFFFAVFFDDATIINCVYKNFYRFSAAKGYGM
tara:strand:+ start:1748 stop:2035 length:288 start_codon:yes stop_codon:yes gene_type:complete